MKETYDSTRKIERNENMDKIREKSTLPLCSYGCGRKAIKYLAHLGTYCCETKSDVCPNYRNWQENLKDSTKHNCYWCGGEAKHFLTYSQKWCCSPYHMECSTIIL